MPMHRTLLNRSSELGTHEHLAPVQMLKDKKWGEPKRFDPLRYALTLRTLP